MSFLFLITLLNIMPNRLLLLILLCLFWVNQISWCQLCAIWHLLLLANYWRKDKLVTVHTAISTPCGKGTGSPATQYARYSKSVLGVEDEELAAGGWGWTPGAAREQLPGAERQEAAGARPGAPVRQGARNGSQIPARLRKASRFQGLFVSSTVWCFLICINPTLRSRLQTSTPIIPPSFDFGCPACLQRHGTLRSSSNTHLGFLCPVVTVKLILFKWLIWFKWLITLLLVPLT